MGRGHAKDLAQLAPHSRLRGWGSGSCSWGPRSHSTARENASNHYHPQSCCGRKHSSEPQSTRPLVRRESLGLGAELGPLAACGLGTASFRRESQPWSFGNIRRILSALARPLQFELGENWPAAGLEGWTVWTRSSGSCIYVHHVWSISPMPKPQKRNNTYYLDRLKRDHPKIHADYLAGKFPSALQAFEAAGL